MEKTDHR